MKKILLILILLGLNAYLVIELILTRHTIRVATTNIAYLQNKIEKLTQLNDAFSLEKAHLSGPYRIDIIATQELDMVKPENRLIGKEYAKKNPN